MFYLFHFFISILFLTNDIYANKCEDLFTLSPDKIFNRLTDYENTNPVIIKIKPKEIKNLTLKEGRLKVLLELLKGAGLQPTFLRDADLMKEVPMNKRLGDYIISYKYTIRNPWGLVARDLKVAFEDYDLQLVDKDTVGLKNGNLIKIISDNGKMLELKDFNETYLKEIEKGLNLDNISSEQKENLKNLISKLEDINRDNKIYDPETDFTKFEIILNHVSKEESIILNNAISNILETDIYYKLPINVYFELTKIFKYIFGPQPLDTKLIFQEHKKLEQIKNLQEFIFYLVIRKNTQSAKNLGSLIYRNKFKIILFAIAVYLVKTIVEDLTSGNYDPYELN